MTRKIETDKMDIYFEGDSILVRQKWRYVWTGQQDLQEWTIEEKRDFHNKADMLIWKIWGGTNYKIIISGNRELCRKYPSGLKIRFDIQWVLYAEHWTVYVRKMKKDENYGSVIAYDNKWIDLSSQDIYKSERYNATYNEIGTQFTIVHEFGHAIGNTRTIDNMHGDEYIPRSPYCRDFNSVMNIGIGIRERHFDYLIKILNERLYPTVFSIR